MVFLLFLLGGCLFSREAPQSLESLGAEGGALGPGLARDAQKEPQAERALDCVVGPGRAAAWFLLVLAPSGVLKQF